MVVVQPRDDEKSWERPAGAPAAPGAEPAQHADPSPRPPINATSEWQAHKTADGRTFWHNPITKEKTWERPAGAPETPAQQPEEKPAEVAGAATWEEVKAPDGRVFWYNRATKEKSWDRPQGFAGAADEKPGNGNWEEITTNDGRVFWYDRVTKEKTWEKPVALRQM